MYGRDFEDCWPNFYRGTKTPSQTERTGEGAQIIDLLVNSYSVKVKIKSLGLLLQIETVTGQAGIEAAFQVPMPGDSGSSPDVGSISNYCLTQEIFTPTQVTKSPTASSGSQGAVAHLNDTGRGMSRNIPHPEGCPWKNNNKLKLTIKC